MNRQLSKYVQQTMDAIGDKVLTKSTVEGNYYDSERIMYNGSHVDRLVELGYVVKWFDSPHFVWLFRVKEK